MIKIFHRWPPQKLQMPHQWSTGRLRLVANPGANFKMSRTILVHLSTLRMQKSSMNIDIGGQDEDNRGSNVSLNRRMLLL